ncbi:IS30 family transposase [Amphritea sp. HPY]|uniref:IS30 family transposase n=1 Tax=Amphritea sp. HPY TaxID=3421652 RepID=UPI003D7CD8F0
MARRTRLKYTSSLKAEIWDRYKAGQSLWSIARSIDRSSSSIYGQLAPTGGIRPPERIRSSRSLSLAEREEISRGIVANLSIRAIASQLGRAPSTISREINRNGGSHNYRAAKADQSTWDKARRPKSCKLANNHQLSGMIESKLRRKWSPEQIAGWLKREYPGDESNQVSHETIYRSLFIQARGVLKKELQQYLRSKRSIRRAKNSSLKRDGLGSIPKAISISERPATVEDRAVPGHWEGDLIEGSNNSCIATLVERHSRYVMLFKLANKKTDTVVSALLKQARMLPEELYKSLTWDRGTEMKGHQRFTLETDIQVYFCDPYSPWQRGSNENTNRLLRQYLPKGTNLSVHSQATLNKIARELNERPRKTLAYETPADRFNACVATTH